MADSTADSNRIIRFGGPQQAKETNGPAVLSYDVPASRRLRFGAIASIAGATDPPLHAPGGQVLGMLIGGIQDGFGSMSQIDYVGLWEVWSRFAAKLGYPPGAIQTAKPRFEGEFPVFADPDEYSQAWFTALSEFRNIARSAGNGDNGYANWEVSLPRHFGDLIALKAYSWVPRYVVQQVFEVSLFPTRYGLGRTVSAISLLPGEEQEINVETWRTVTESRERTSSVIDSFDETSKTDLQRELSAETTEGSEYNRTLDWYTDANASVDFGFVKGGAKGGASGTEKWNMQEAGKQIQSVLQNHAEERNRHRQVEVSGRDQIDFESGSKFASARRIKNVNLRNVLNVVFRELNQVYECITHLVDIRIGIRSDIPGDARFVSLIQAESLLEYVSSTNFPADLHGLHVTVHNLVREFGVLFDDADTPQVVLEEVRAPDWAVVRHLPSFFSALPRATPATAADALVSSSDRHWRFRRNLHPSEVSRDVRDAIGQDDRSPKVRGLVVARDEVVTKTPSVLAEALLGEQDALDAFAMRMQKAAIVEKELANKRVRLGLEIVAATNTPYAYQQVFNAPPSDQEDP